VIFASFGQKGKKGLTAKTMKELKDKLRPAVSDFTVVKKTLMERALDNAEFPGRDEVKSVEGSLGVVFGYGEIVAPAKEFYAVSQNTGSIDISFGLLHEDEVELLIKERILTLATLPTREVLLAHLAGAIKAPLYLLRSVLEANIKNLVLILGNLKR
jgi:large subunit ribosomal protein L10